MSNLDQKNITSIVALLVHAAKIDERYSENEETLIKEFIKSYLKDVDVDKGLEDYKLPAQAERYLNKAVDAIKGANLNRKRQVAALARIVKALNLDKSDLIRYFAKIKRGL